MPTTPAAIAPTPARWPNTVPVFASLIVTGSPLSAAISLIRPGFGPDKFSTAIS